MDVVMSDINFETCLNYLDDIIVFSHILEDHLLRLEPLLQRLRQVNLKQTPSKCQLLKRRVAFLRFVVSEERVGTDPDKIKAVLN